MTVTASSVPATVTFIRFVLRMLEPGAVTVPRPVRRGEVDAVPDVDCHGRAHLPGTSLAGALRDRTRTVYGDQVTKTWFGHLLDPGPEQAPDTVDAVASAVWVLGSQLITDDGRPREDDADLRIDRWSTSIDRSRGAAKATGLHGITLLTPGTRFEVFLRWDGATADDRDRLLHLLTGWQPVIGRGTSRGLGRCTVEALWHGTLDLTSPTDLYPWLTRSGPDLARAVATRRPADGIDGPALPAPYGLVIEIPAEVAGPLHLGGRRPDRDPDDRTTGRPEVAQVLTEGGRFVVPGAGLKGLLRARIEFILRSVGLDDHACISSGEAAVPCGVCWTCQLFGHAGAHDETTSSVGRRAGLRVCDTAIEDAVPRHRQHVAIDRFTGGAADQLLYTDEVIESGRFTIRLELHPDHADDDLTRALLRLALADLDDGLIGLGRASTRGYGSVRLDLAGAEDAGACPTLSKARTTLAAAHEHPAVAPTPRRIEEVSS